MRETNVKFLRWVVKLIKRFLSWLFFCSKGATKITFYVLVEGEWRKIMANLSIFENEKVVLTASPEDAKDRVVSVDGLISWASSDESVVRLEVAPDGFTATAFAVAGTVGAPTIRTATIVAKADADRGTGVREVLGSFEIEVKLDEAVEIVITAGDVLPQ